jgi:hypothetical protein
VYLEWPSGAPDIVAAAWMQDGDIAGLINLYEVVALIQGHAVLTLKGFILGSTLVEIQVDLDGSRSKSPSERPIVRYVWEWSDGVVQEGVTATRTFPAAIPWQLGQQAVGVGSVTLTVWNSAGESSSVTLDIPAVTVHALA